MGLGFILLGWVWITLGLLSGVPLGLAFHRDDWLGGYASWQRRLLRLGHVAFFGTGFLLLASGWTMRTLAPAIGSTSATLLSIGGFSLLVGAITMPLVCGMAAWRKPARHLFVVPVLGLLLGSALNAAAVLIHISGTLP